MMNNNVKVIYKKITRKFEQIGYINLNHREINSKNDLVEIATIFRNPKYETFRIIYLLDNKVVGYEYISSKHPSSVNIFEKFSNSNGYINREKGFYKMQSRMNRLGANGYYMVHNHPSGNVEPSKADIQLTADFIKNLNGFKGHLIIGNDTYSMLTICPYHKYKLRDTGVQQINFKKADKMAKFLSQNSIYNVKIRNRNDLVSLIQNLNRTKDFSTAILTDNSLKVRMILDIPNKMLNENVEQLNGYFRNLARENGVTSVFFATIDSETFKKSKEHLEYGTFKDTFCYKELEKNKICIEDASSEKSTKSLFREELKRTRIPIVACTELSVNKDITLRNNSVFEMPKNEEDYIEIPVNSPDIDLNTEDNFEPRKGEIKVLYKRAGKKPIVKVIPDTLEAKQKLVGGLIEVIPYTDDTLLVCNDEGKILNLKNNVCFTYDYIAGDCFVIGDDYKNAGFRSLTNEEIIKAKEDLLNKSFDNLENENVLPEEKDYSKQDERDL